MVRPGIETPQSPNPLLSRRRLGDESQGGDELPKDGRLLQGSVRGLGRQRQDQSNSQETRAGDAGKAREKREARNEVMS